MSDTPTPAPTRKVIAKIPADATDEERDARLERALAGMDGLKEQALNTKGQRNESVGENWPRKNLTVLQIPQSQCKFVPDVYWDEKEEVFKRRDPVALRQQAREKEAAERAARRAKGEEVGADGTSAALEAEEEAERRRMVTGIVGRRQALAIAGTF